jgi:hypothetical protein
MMANQAGMERISERSVADVRLDLAGVAGYRLSGCEEG